MEISESALKKQVDVMKSETKPLLFRNGEPADPKVKARGRHLLKEIIKQAAKDSGSGLDVIRQNLKERARRRTIAQKRGIEPGTKRWRALVDATTKRRSKGK